MIFYGRKIVNYFQNVVTNFPGISNITEEVHSNFDHSESYISSDRSQEAGAGFSDTDSGPNADLKNLDLA